MFFHLDRIRYYFVLLVISGAPVAQAFQTASLPAEKGAEIVKNKCLDCHGADLIVQQRLGRAAWVRELDKMIRWGAEAKTSEKEMMTDYLARHFGPKSAAETVPPGSPGERGSMVFKARCLNCHEADLTEQQRLSRAGWVREIDKMIRWGAEISNSEKDPLIQYLAAKFPAPR